MDSRPLLAPKFTRLFSSCIQDDHAGKMLARWEYGESGTTTHDPHHQPLNKFSGPQGKSEDQPPAKQIAPAEGVTPPAEVHACPTVHSAPCTTRYRCLPTGVTGSRSRPTPPGFGQMFYVGLTHGSVSHSRTPASRSSGGFMIPTTPCPPECMWTCRTSTVCLLPRR